MSDLRPFRALRYDPKRVDLAKVLVPPYDVVTPRERAMFWDRDPHNAIRLELTRDAEDEAGTEYTEVSEALTQWQREGVLRRDDEPGFYALRQRYTAPSGEALERTGFFGALHLEDYERRIVRPHERTMSGPKADRLKQLRATRTNLSPIFLLYEDREQEIAGVLASAFEGEVLSARDEAGTEHQLARLTDPEALRRLQEFLAPRPLVIADGHHRYETALAYRDERRAEGDAAADAPFESTLAFVANAHAPGSLLLPIHRVILQGSAPDDAGWRQRLPGWQHERVDVPSAEALPELLARHLTPLAARHAFAADAGDGTLHVFQRALAPGDPLTIRVIHREVIEGVFGLDEAAVRDGAVAFPKSTAQAASRVREGDGQVALYLNPLLPDDVFVVTAAGEVMPQKSTFFYPKLPSGLVFRPLEDAP